MRFVIETSDSVGEEHLYKKLRDVLNEYYDIYIEAQEAEEDINLELADPAYGHTVGGVKVKWR